jgi:hypothetical protein
MQRNIRDGLAALRTAKRSVAHADDFSFPNTGRSTRMSAFLM